MKHLLNIWNGRLKDIFYTLDFLRNIVFRTGMLWGSLLKRFLYVIFIETSFVRFGFLWNIFCTLWMSFERLLYVMGIFVDTFFVWGLYWNIFCTFWDSLKHLLNVMNVFWTSFVCCGYLPYVLQIPLWWCHKSFTWWFKNVFRTHIRCCSYVWCHLK